MLLQINLNHMTFHYLLPVFVRSFCHRRLTDIQAPFFPVSCHGFLRSGDFLHVGFGNLSSTRGSHY